MGTTSPIYPKAGESGRGHHHLRRFRPLPQRSRRAAHALGESARLRRVLQWNQMQVAVESESVVAEAPPAAAVATPRDGEPAIRSLAADAEVVMAKMDGERSFGMSLLMDRRVRDAQFACVSCVIPHSPAFRAGLQEGWVVLRINGQSTRGRGVREVAMMFRDLETVALSVEKRQPVRRAPTIPMAPMPASTSLPLPSIASDGFEIIDVRPGPSVSATPASVAPLSVQLQQSAEDKKPNQETHQAHKLTRPEAAADTQPKPTAVSMNSSPKEVGSRSASPMPRMAAKSRGQALPTASTAMAPARINGGDVHADHGAAEPKQASTLPEDRHNPVKSGPVPAVRKRAVVTPVLRLSAIPKTAPAFPSAPPLRLQGPAMPPPAVQAVTSGSSIPVGPTTTTTLSRSSVEQPVANGRVLPTATASNAAGTASKRRTPVSEATKTSEPPRQARRTSLTASVRKSSQDAGEDEEKAPVPAATAVEDESEEKAPVPAPAATAPNAVPLDVHAAPGPRLTVSTAPPAPTTSSASTTRSTPTTRGSKKAAKASSSRKKASPKTTVRSPPSPAVQAQEEAPCTPPTGPRPLPLSPAQGRKRGRPKKGSNSTKASRRAAANRQAASWIEPEVSSYREPKEEYTDPPIEMYQHLFFESLDGSDGGTPESQRRRNANRRTRPRHSLTIERLEAMGFTREESELGVTHCGDDTDKCMLWIVSNREEIQFNEELNRASIESERSKHVEAERSKQEEGEALRNAKEFTRVFTTSFILSDDSSAATFKEMLDSTIGDVAPGSFLRDILTKLLKLESEAIRWYKQASRAYMLQLADRLEAALGAHDVLSCCSQVAADAVLSADCGFIQLLVEEERTLKHILFTMPGNQGGVPVAFLEADESMHFSLDDDGFEVVDVPPPSED